jgi:flagellar biosynthesis protein
VASGRGAVGEAIIAKAKEAGVPIQQNPALAEALATIELDSEIPEALYKAVAQVLAFIMKTAGHLK